MQFDQQCSTPSPVVSCCDHQKKMFAFLICILTLQQVHSACVVQDICTENKTVQAEIIDHHNAFRRAVQPTASDMLIMSYSEEVAASAQAWVDKCILAHGSPSTRMLDGYELGENLFYSSSPTLWKDVVNAWHSEVSRYLYPKGSRNGQETGHYTQVIWNSSYKVGCGVTLCPNNVYFYGCHYYRAGNFKGWPPYKLGSPCASCPDHCEDKLCTNPCPYINKFINCPAMKDTTGCGNKYVYGWCPASCKCTDEIIPIY
ncbi:cysteine-rich venom protein isoform X1 [Sebastes umbrosus]|uniref:cysteine-rich venom protein isoform X1 n=2 Tax=Sebastes umbrosus TaxID=72105 RepID=UPI00189F3208|nr:cysteine-rich venom protein isoform X1 [Sebastes umbrosus]